jgi:hypothetical protein
MDVGVEIDNNYRKVKGLEWAFGIFNGSRSATYWRDFSPVFVGRIGYNNTKGGYLPTDFEGGPFRFAIGLSASTELDHDANNKTLHYAELDGIIKVYGLSISAAGYIENIAEKHMADNAKLNRIGSFLQAGYLINKRFEPVVRSGFIHNYQVDNDIKLEVTGGLTIFFFGQNFKWENNFSLLTERIDESSVDPHAMQDIRFSSQMQFMF